MWPRKGLMKRMQPMKGTGKSSQDMDYDVEEVHYGGEAPH